jgi:hypothetical protein
MALPTKQHGGNVSHLLPSELVDKCVGSRIWVRSPTPSLHVRAPVTAWHRAAAAAPASARIAPCRPRCACLLAMSGALSA